MSYHHKKKRQTIPTVFQKKTLWNAITAISIVVLFAAAILGVYTTNYILGFLEPVLLPVIVAAILAYLLEPIISWRERRKMSRTMAGSTVMVVLILCVVGFFCRFVPDLANQTNNLFQDRERIWNQTTSLVDTTLEQPLVQKAVDSLYHKSIRELQSENYTPEETATILAAKDTRDKLIVYLDLNSSFLMSKAVSWLTSGGKVLFGSLGMIVGLVMVPIFTFYFLKESGSIKAHWHDLLPLKTSKFKKEVVETLQEINGYLISFFRGQMLVSIIDGVLIAILLYICGLQYAFTIGVAVAILGIIPYLGTIITLIPALLIAWTNCPDWWIAEGWPIWGFTVLVLGIFILVNQFDSWIIQPKIVGDSVGLHPLTVMFSVLFWTLVLGGLVGALLAVPLTAALKVLFRRYIWESMRKEQTFEQESLIE